jgi:hypothetical protein
LVGWQAAIASKLAPTGEWGALIVPTLRVVMHPVTLCVTFKSGTRSVPGGIPTQSVGTITQGNDHKKIEAYRPLLTTQQAER